MTQRQWTPQDDENLASHLARDSRSDDIARAMGWSANTIRRRAKTPKVRAKVSSLRGNDYPPTYYEGVAAFPDGDRPYVWTDGPDYYWYMAGWYDAQLGYHDR